MAEIESLAPGGVGDIGTEILENQMSRRNFLVAAGFVGMGIFGGVRAAGVLAGKSPIMYDSYGVLFHDANRCVGCRRCELACSDFNNGAGSAYLTRCRVSRNASWGWQGATQGMQFIEGTDGGNFKIRAEICKQCPHPVPCAEACPRGAIELTPTTRARKINTAKCIGCGICNVACPWQMPVLDRAIMKSQKCFLCDGNPECAHACPTAAMTFIPWRDLRTNNPVIKSGIMPVGTTTDCSSCHQSPQTFLPGM
jgi:Fe-S-cluster-containing dehydrogenase component